MFKSFATILIIILTGSLLVSYILTRDEQVMEQQNVNILNEEIITRQNLTDTAKIYTSRNLGLAFSYEPKPAETFEVTVTERDNKIFVHGTNEQPEQGKVIEVFQKNSNLSLKQAMEEQFLRNYSPSDCFVEEIPQAQEDPRPDSYVFAEISYPPPASSEAPFWENLSKCPQAYGKVNAVRYFMMDSQKPDRFFFLDLGQDSITLDGSKDKRQDWSASVRIF